MDCRPFTSVSDREHRIRKGDRSGTGDDSRYLSLRTQINRRRFLRNGHIQGVWLMQEKVCEKNPRRGKEMESASTREIQKGPRSGNGSQLQIEISRFWEIQERFSEWVLVFSIPEQVDNHTDIALQQLNSGRRDPEFPCGQQGLPLARGRNATTVDQRPSHFFESSW